MNTKFITLFLNLLIFLSPVYASPNFSYQVSPKINDIDLVEQGNSNSEVFKVGISERYLSSEIYDDNLDSLWNSWHANVRNHISQSIRNVRFPKGYVLEFFYTVTNSKQIENVVILYVPRQSLIQIKGKGYIKPDSFFYGYSNDNNKFYKLYVKNHPHSLDGKKMRQIFANSVMEEINPYDVPYFIMYKPMANLVVEKSYQNFLAFPENSTKDKVVVSQGITDFNWVQSTNGYTNNMFNETETR